MSEALVTHTGSCHCGRARFEVDAPETPTVHECNCSICARVGYLHLIVDRDRFRALSGEDALTAYRFGTETANHLFCPICGVKPWYVPRSHPEGVSVNARCLDRGTVDGMVIEQLNGREWEKQFPKGRGEYKD